MDNYFYVLEIYGMGGVGKSRFLRYLKNNQFKNENSLIYVSLEISKKEQILDNLIAIRKQIPYCVPNFDFALIKYWDERKLEQVDDSFFNLIKSNVLVSLSDIFKDCEANFHLLSFPSFEDIVNIINKIYVTYKRKDAKHYLSFLGWDDQELLYNLPILLGHDLKNYSQNHNKCFIFIFDSYQQSIPYSETQEWLYRLIGATQVGFFIITSREKLLWTDKEHHILPYELKELPEDASKELLEKYLLKKDFYLIPQIIKSTGCIPIYLNLALDIYQLSYRNEHSCVTNSMFPDKGSLVNKFINHLPQNHQDIILVLGIINIFDNNIFEYIVKELNIPFPIHKFEDLCNTTLINYVENTANFYKFHDVFAENIIRIHSSYEISKTFQVYLKFISTHGLYMYSDRQINTLFLNILELYSKFSIIPEFEVAINEMIIKIFLSLISKKARFDLPNKWLKNSKSTSNHDVLLFVYAVLCEKSDTLYTTQMLSEIKKPECFGKQKISYELIKLYCNALIGEYDKFGNTIEDINKRLNYSDIGEWYYTRTKCYLADYYLMRGNFSSSYQVCLNTINEYENMPLGDLYHFKRIIGHIQRFNFLIEQAINSYENLFMLYNDNTNLRVYILTNICETACYFNDEIFCKYIDKAFSIASLLKNQKNIAKLYYSKAIFLLRKELYEEAQKSINISIKINQKDGYQSGVLFALMAQAYLDYSLFNHILYKSLLYEILRFFN